MKRLIQNRVASSRWTLTAAILWAAVVWVADGLVTEGWWLQLGCYILSTYLMVELNNSHALIRTYTRTVSAALLILTAMVGNLGSLTTAFTILCTITVYVALFQTYQDRTASGWTFYAFLALSLDSLADARMLLIVPLLWAHMLFTLHNFSWRTFLSSVFGIVFPYWILAGWYTFRGEAHLLADHFACITTWDETTVTATDWITTVSTALMLTLALTSIIHYMRNVFADKIRIRQYFYCFITFTVLSGVLLTVQPFWHEQLRAILIVNLSPLVAHFFTLTHTRWTNMVFLTTLVAAAVLTVLRLWML